MEPEVRDAMLTFMDQEFGNEGSRTHAYGMRAKQAVQKARDQICGLFDATRNEIIFTSGATESINLAVYGLVPWAKKHKKLHIISTTIEHQATLGPIKNLEENGFEVTLVKPNKSGYIDPEEIKKNLREETFLIAVMHANNETGIFQPIDEICDKIKDHPAYFLVDAAQTAGKILNCFNNKRINLIAASAHKMYGPKGVGCLVVKSATFEPVPIEPIIRGGGQEHGLRSGTLPVHLIIGFGEAAKICIRDFEKRKKLNREKRVIIKKAISLIDHKIIGDETKSLDHTIFVIFNKVNSEAAMVCLKNDIAVSNGSACSSSKYTGSYVLESMGYENSEISSAIRISWCHLTPNTDFDKIFIKLRDLS
jgi:cysteine desulfurase